MARRKTAQAVQDQPPVETTPETNGAVDKKKPLVSFKCNSDRTTVIEVALWSNDVEIEKGEIVQRYSTSFTRSFKKDGKWTNGSRSYRTHDLPVLQFLLHKVWEHALSLRAT